MYGCVIRKAPQSMQHCTLTRVESGAHSTQTWSTVVVGVAGIVGGGCVALSAAPCLTLASAYEKFRKLKISFSA